MITTALGALTSGLSREVGRVPHSKGAKRAGNTVGVGYTAFHMTILALLRSIS